jgi:hypothetical protein
LVTAIDYRAVLIRDLHGEHIALKNPQVHVAMPAAREESSDHGSTEKADASPV